MNSYLYQYGSMTGMTSSDSLSKMFGLSQSLIEDHVNSGVVLKFVYEGIIGQICLAVSNP